MSIEWMNEHRSTVHPFTRYGVPGEYSLAAGTVGSATGAGGDEKRRVSPQRREPGSSVP